MAGKRKPPEINPFIFPAILAFFGLWCFWDGWLTADPEMHEHLLFNRVASSVLIPWAIWDFFKTRKNEREYKLRKQQDELKQEKSQTDPDDAASNDS